MLLADAVASRLAGEGLIPGDRVLVWLPDGGAVHAALLGCERAGVKRIVNFSSETVYGHTEGAVSEASTGNEASGFGINLMGAGAGGIRRLPIEMG